MKVCFRVSVPCRMSLRTATCSKDFALSDSSEKNGWGASRGSLKKPIPAGTCLFWLLKLPALPRVVLLVEGSPSLVKVRLEVRSEVVCGGAALRKRPRLRVENHERGVARCDLVVE